MGYTKKSSSHRISSPVSFHGSQGKRGREIEDSEKREEKAWHNRRGKLVEDDYYKTGITFSVDGLADDCFYVRSQKYPCQPCMYCIQKFLSVTRNLFLDTVYTSLQQLIIFHCMDYSKWMKEA